MILSVTAALEAGQYSPIVLRGPYESVMKQAADIGYAGIELHLENPSQVDGKKLKSMADSLGLKVTALGTGGAYGKRGIFLASEEEDIRRQAVQYIKEHIDLAKELTGTLAGEPTGEPAEEPAWNPAGTPGCVVILGLIKGKICQCRDRETYFRRLDRSMAECVSYAESQGVILVMEMINRYESDVFNRISEGLEYVRKFHSDYLRLHLDTFHMNIEEGQISHEIRMAQGMIGHVHMADSDRWYAGHGHYDFAETIRVLKEIGYEGAISLESYCFPKPEVSAARSFEFLNRLLQGQEERSRL